MRTADRQHIPSAGEIVAAAAADPTTPYGAAVAAAQAVPAAERLETQEDLVRRLETELATLTLKAKAVSDAIKAGDVEAASCMNLTELATRSAELQGQLTAARKVAANADFYARQESRQRDKQDFEAFTEAARRARAEFQVATRTAELALGRYCENTERAILLNTQIRAGFPAPDVERQNQLRDLEDRSLLLPQLVEGHGRTMGYGWNLGIQISPLIKEK